MLGADGSGATALAADGSGATALGAEGGGARSAEAGRGFAVEPWAAEAGVAGLEASDAEF